jgi:hypothetical protein
MGARMRITPTTRTVAALEGKGWLVDVVERRQGPITRDLFGCFDLIAVHPEQCVVLLVQVTSASNFASRLAKVCSQTTTVPLLRAGIALEVWGWSDGASPRIERLIARGHRVELAPPASRVRPAADEIASPKRTRRKAPIDQPAAARAANAAVTTCTDDVATGAARTADADESTETPAVTAGTNNSAETIEA